MITFSMLYTICLPGILTARKTKQKLKHYEFIARFICNKMMIDWQFDVNMTSNDTKIILQRVKPNKDPGPDSMHTYYSLSNLGPFNHFTDIINNCIAF